MKVKLPSRSLEVKVKLCNSRIRVRVPSQFPGGGTPPVVVCQVTYTDDTCVDYTDGTFAEYQ